MKRPFRTFAGPRFRQLAMVVPSHATQPWRVGRGASFGGSARRGGFFVEVIEMFRRSRAETDRETDRADVPEIGTQPRRVGVGFVGLLIMLLGAWGALVPYLGPDFGLR